MEVLIASAAAVVVGLATVQFITIGVIIDGIIGITFLAVYRTVTIDIFLPIAVPTVIRIRVQRISRCCVIGIGDEDIGLRTRGGSIAIWIGHPVGCIVAESRREAEAAAINCRRSGCNPPWRDELTNL